MNETLWKHKEKKWTPVDKQAALILRKAKPFFLPPETPNRGFTFAQLVEMEAERRRKRISVLEAENRKAEELSRIKQAEHKLWQQEQNKGRIKLPPMFARNERREAKRLGKPIPTLNQIREKYYALATGKIRV